jgi:hypothetical protein
MEKLVNCNRGGLAKNDLSKRPKRNIYPEQKNRNSDGPIERCYKIGGVLRIFFVQYFMKTKLSAEEVPIISISKDFHNMNQSMN